MKTFLPTFVLYNTTSIGNANMLLSVLESNLMATFSSVFKVIFLLQILYEAPIVDCRSLNATPVFTCFIISRVNFSTFLFEALTVDTGTLGGVSAFDIAQVLLR